MIVWERMLLNDDSRKFITKAGRLTPYAYACGYIQRATTTDGKLNIMVDMPSPGARFYRIEINRPAGGGFSKKVAIRDYQTLTGLYRDLPRLLGEAALTSI